MEISSLRVPRSISLDDDNLERLLKGLGTVLFVRKQEICCLKVVLHRTLDKRQHSDICQGEGKLSDMGI